MQDTGLPYYIDIKTIKQKLNIDRRRIDAWIRAGKLSYVIFSPDKRAKKIFATKEVLKIIEEHKIS